MSNTTDIPPDATRARDRARAGERARFPSCADGGSRCGKNGRKLQTKSAQKCVCANVLSLIHI
eukprot:1240623-Pyramimonas_sp.AAC.1